MKLKALTDGLVENVGATSAGDVEVRQVTIDSRRAGPGVVFVACPGATPTSKDGHAYIPQAIAAGAAAVVLERGRPVPSGVPVYVAENTRVAAAKLAERVSG